MEAPDLVIGPGDVRPADGKLTVTDHNIGAALSPATRIHVLDERDQVVAEIPLPATDAPLDLKPKTATVTGELRRGAKGELRIAAGQDDGVREITRLNNHRTVHP